MLFVWLFGFALGAVHACLAPTAADVGGAERPAAVGEAASRQVGLEQASHDAGPNVVQTAAHDDSPGASNCHSFCEKSASTPSLKSVPDDFHGHASPPSAGAFAIALPAALPDPLLLTPRRDGGPAVPIAIAFLRLAL